MAKKRKSGTGTVRQRGDGRWEGRVVIGYDDNGLPKTKNVLAKTKRECQEKLKTLTESMVGRNDRKVKPDMQKAASGIVGGFMEDLLGKGLRPWQRNGKAEPAP